MVAQVGALRVTVGADTSGLQTGMARAQRQVAQSSAAMQRSVTGVTTSFKNLGAMVGLSLGGAALFAGARGLLRLADASKQLQAQLRLATDGFGSFEQANKDVQRIAEITRSGLVETANLYAVFQRNARELGISQAQAARATETVNKTFQISGASAAEAAGGLRQFLQALQSGQLRGEEFNSVMENAPRLARLLADSLGVTIGQLRAMAKEGEITGDKLVAALTDRKFTDAIDEEFSRLPVTFDQAMQQIYNAAVITFGAFDQGGQFSNALANFITGGTEGFANLESSAYSFGVELRSFLDGLDAIREAFASVRTEGVAAMFDIELASFSLRDALETVLGVVDGMVNAFVNLFQAPANLGRLISGAAPVFGSSNLRGAFAGAADQSKQDAARRRIMGRSSRDVFAEFGLGTTPPPFRAFSSGGGGKKKGRSGPSAETLAKRAEREMEQRLRRDAAFAAEQRQNQIAILRAEQELVTDYERRTALTFKILELEEQQELAQIDLSVKLKDRTEGEAEILRQQVADLAQIKKEVALREEEAQLREDAARLEETRLDIRIEQLQAESGLVTTAEESRDVQLRILDLEYQRERAALERLAADESATAAAREEARMRLAGLGAKYQSDRAGVVVSTRGPLEQWAASVPQTAAQIREAFQSIQVDALEGLSDAITDLITGTKSLADAFGDMARQIIADIIRMTVRMLIFRAISSALGGLFGGSGEAISVTSSNFSGSFGGFRAGGGPVVPGKTYVVGENGPELLHMGGYGQVIPGGGSGGRAVVELRLMDDMLDARIVQGANAVVEVKRPSIVKDARRTTVKALTRPGF